MLTSVQYCSTVPLLLAAALLCGTAILPVLPTLIPVAIELITALRRQARPVSSGRQQQLQHQHVAAGCSALSLTAASAPVALVAAVSSVMLSHAAFLGTAASLSFALSAASSSALPALPDGHAASAAVGAAAAVLHQAAALPDSVGDLAAAAAEGAAAAAAQTGAADGPHAQLPDTRIPLSPSVIVEEKDGEREDEQRLRREQQQQTVTEAVETAEVGFSPVGLLQETEAADSLLSLTPPPSELDSGSSPQQSTLCGSASAAPVPSSMFTLVNADVRVERPPQQTQPDERDARRDSRSAVQQQQQQQQRDAQHSQQHLQQQWQQRHAESSGPALMSSSSSFQVPPQQPVHPRLQPQQLLFYHPGMGIPPTALHPAAQHALPAGAASHLYSLQQQQQQAQSLHSHSHFHQLPHQQQPQPQHPQQLQQTTYGGCSLISSPSLSSFPPLPATAVSPSTTLQTMLAIEQHFQSLRREKQCIVAECEQYEVSGLPYSPAQRALIEHDLNRRLQQNAAEMNATASMMDDTVPLMTQAELLQAVHTDGFPRDAQQTAAVAQPAKDSKEERGREASLPQQEEEEERQRLIAEDEQSRRETAAARGSKSRKKKSGTQSPKRDGKRTREGGQRAASSSSSRMSGYIVSNSGVGAAQPSHAQLPVTAVLSPGCVCLLCASVC